MNKSLDYIVNTSTILTRPKIQNILENSIYILHSHQFPVGNTQLPNSAFKKSSKIQ